MYLFNDAYIKQIMCLLCIIYLFGLLISLTNTIFIYLFIMNL